MLLAEVIQSSDISVSSLERPEEWLQRNSEQEFSPEQRRMVETFALDTAQSLLSMLDERTLLPHDTIELQANGDGSFDNKTSATNIGLAIANLLSMKEMEIVPGAEANEVLSELVRSIDALDKSHGLLYDWYDPRDGSLLTSDSDGRPKEKMISSVDNAWLAFYLNKLKYHLPESEMSHTAGRLLEEMREGFDTKLFDPEAGLFYGMYYPDRPSSEQNKQNWHYDLLNSETRIIYYTAIACFDYPPRLLQRLSKTMPGGKSDKSRVLYGLPTWSGGAFEEWAVETALPESRYSPLIHESHIAHLQHQIDYGRSLDPRGYWGTSACLDPEGNYLARGIPADRLCPEPPIVSEDRKRSSDGVVTPHALFMAMQIAPTLAADELKRLAIDFPNSYIPERGFVDSIDTKTGEVSGSQLYLDQAWSFEALNNVLKRPSSRSLRAAVGKKGAQRLGVGLGSLVV